MENVQKPAGYIRVSSEEQAQHGISVDAQRDILRAWGVMRQAGDVVLYEDAGFSGKNTDRPALQRLLGDVRAGRVSDLVVWKLDRLSRSLRDTLSIIEDDLQPNGVTLHSVTESIDTGTPSGRMMLNILASFAQLEREQDSDRVVMAHKHLARDCRYLGGHVALGYRVDDDRHFQLDPATAPIVRRVFEMYLARCGYAQILEYLNTEASRFQKRRTPWGKSDLNYLLSNEIYAGIYTRRIGADRRSKVTHPETIRVEGGVPAILTPDEWARVCSLRESNILDFRSYGGHVCHPLAGLVRCGSCGRLMQLNYGGKDRDGTVQRYYQCAHRCVKPARLEPLEDAVLAAVAAMGDHKAEIRNACRIANGFAGTETDERRAATAPLDAELLNIHRRQARILAMITDAEERTPRTLLDELRRLEAAESALTARRENLLRPVALYAPDEVIDALDACRDIQKEPAETQRELLQRALHAVQITDGSFRLVLNWRVCGGDDPPPYTCQLVLERPVRSHLSVFSVLVSVDTSGSPARASIQAVIKPRAPADSAAIQLTSFSTKAPVPM